MSCHKQESILLLEHIPKVFNITSFISSAFNHTLFIFNVYIVALIIMVFVLPTNFSEAALGMQIMKNKNKNASYAR